jgi:hypothetical protein
VAPNAGCALLLFAKKLNPKNRSAIFNVVNNCRNIITKITNKNNIISTNKIFFIMLIVFHGSLLVGFSGLLR